MCTSLTYFAFCAVLVFNFDKHSIGHFALKYDGLVVEGPPPSTRAMLAFEWARTRSLPPLASTLVSRPSESTVLRHI